MWRGQRSTKRNKLNQSLWVNFFLSSFLFQSFCFPSSFFLILLLRLVLLRSYSISILTLLSTCLRPLSNYYDLSRPGKILRSYAYLRSYNIEVKLNLNQLPKASKLGTCTLQFLYYFIISTIYPRTHHLLLPLGVIICTLIHLIQSYLFSLFYVLLISL